MRARSDVALRPAEPAAAWSRRREDCAASREGSRTADAGAQIHDARGDATNSWTDLLDRYREGWAEANPRKIIAATAHDYRFDDPLVGLFSRWSLPDYLERLRVRFARAGATEVRDLAFFVRGPMDEPRRCGRLKFFREAPRLGLTGITFVTIAERGVIAESVAYDLNLASDVLRGRSADHG